MTVVTSESILDRIERRHAQDLMQRRGALIETLAASARSKPWSFVLFGSLARGDVRRGSDADICIRLAPGASAADAARAWSEARRVCSRFSLTPDVHLFEELPPAIQDAVEREGIACAL